MAITDELRGYVKEQQWCAKGMLTAIADRIDAAHTVAVNTAYDDGVREGRADVADDDWLAKNEDAMAEHGWVKLPKDADGEPIHVGDKLVDKDSKLSKPAIVKCILYNDEGCVVSDIDPHGCWYDPSLLRHHKQPTVEDVLRDFGKAWVEWEDGSPCDPIAEYAAKLRMAGDAE